MQIRKSIFETNSSSSHSLVIRSNNLLNELEENEYFTHEEMLENLSLNKNGVYQSWKNEWYFGRTPFRVVESFEDKFMYAYANFCYDDCKVNELIETMQELVPEITKIEFPENAGVDEPYLRTWLSGRNITLKEFLTNKKYIVIQDGDEYCVWEDLIDAGLIDTKNIKGEMSNV